MLQQSIIICGYELAATAPSWNERLDRPTWYPHPHQRMGATLEPSPIASAWALNHESMQYKVLHVHLFVLYNHTRAHIMLTPATAHRPREGLAESY